MLPSKPVFGWQVAWRVVVPERSRCQQSHRYKGAMASKRKEVEEAAPTDATDDTSVKKTRTGFVGASTSMALVTSTQDEKKSLIVSSGPKRTSSLTAPTMLLEGHAGMVNSCKFNHAGTVLASGGVDKNILFWNTTGDCENVAVLQGHKLAVLDLAFSRNGEHLYSASADGNAAVWDVEICERVRQLKDHTAIVNAVAASCIGDPLVATGSDDCTVKLWDARTRRVQGNLPHNSPVTAVGFSYDSTCVYVGGVDNEIHVWDVRTGKLLYSLVGHTDTVTGLAVDPSGKFLLSNSMDNSARQWDIRPYVSDPSQRLLKSFHGHRHDMQKNLLRCGWSADSSKITAASADRFVYVWDVPSARILYKLPGHKGAVNDVCFHPSEPVIASCSNDKKIYLGEIDI